MTSILVSICAYIISCARGDPHAWGDFRTALLACGMVLFGFAIFHLFRTPWLLHKDVFTGSSEPLEKRYGVFGGLVVLGLIAGVAAATILAVRIAEKNKVTQSAKVDISSGQSSNQNAPITNEPASPSSPVENKNAAQITTTERNRLNRRVPQLIREFQLKFPASASDVNEATYWVNAQLKREGEHGKIVIDRLPPVEKSPTTINLPSVVYFRDCNNCSAQTGDVYYNINVDGKPVSVQPAQNDPTRPQR
jgi:hypothetical protein